ncbi:succinyl-diaminopimelate desuccinylase [Arhodomonas aquaeolei]|uniref:succinyl-diaminopimelate desuccinylase n=1 Tax=Arhodomonas aquaeolei TaxID=2369 RepID=UPI00035E681A|nr:succinyl-diaminopimelate desuccinylase [Arhodomonas aquaeolei]
MSETLELTCELIRRASVTPEDAGCQDLLVERLDPLGFACERLVFGEVTNLWARRGNAAPLFVFAGHTDVVPTGPEADWSSPPFEPTLHEGLLYGRGAADMKGSVAAFVTAVERFIAHHPEHAGSVALLITSDEEGPGINGTRRVVEYLGEQAERIDYCLVGEPSSESLLADTIKIGRRGSLHGHLTVRGTQGHVAYPQRARNPIHAFAPALAALADTQWDQGNDSFPATSFQVSNIRGGTGATNVIPGQLHVDFNFRFSNEVTEADLRYRTEAILGDHGIDFALEWVLSARPFLTEPGPLLAATTDAIEAVTGRATTPSTAGGTSDGRFIAPTGAQIVELGPLNRSIHQIDEHVASEDLEALSAIYEGILVRLLVPGH